MGKCLKKSFYHTLHLGVKRPPSPVLLQHVLTTIYCLIDRSLFVQFNCTIICISQKMDP